VLNGEKSIVPALLSGSRPCGSDGAEPSYNHLVRSSAPYDRLDTKTGSRKSSHP